MRNRKSTLVTLLLLGVSTLSGGCIDGFYLGVQTGVEDAVAGVIEAVVTSALESVLPGE